MCSKMHVSSDACFIETPDLDSSWARSKGFSARTKKHSKCVDDKGTVSRSLQGYELSKTARFGKKTKSEVGWDHKPWPAQRTTKAVVFSLRPFLDSPISAAGSDPSFMVFPQPRCHSGRKSATPTLWGMTEKDPSTTSVRQYRLTDMRRSCMQRSHQMLDSPMLCLGKQNSPKETCCQTTDSVTVY